MEIEKYLQTNTTSHPNVAQGNDLDLLRERNLTIFLSKLSSVATIAIEGLHLFKDPSNTADHKLPTAFGEQGQVHF